MLFVRGYYHLYLSRTIRFCVIVQKFIKCQNKTTKTWDKKDNNLYK